MVLALYLKVSNKKQLDNPNKGNPTLEAEEAGRGNEKTIFLKVFQRPFHWLRLKLTATSPFKKQLKTDRHVPFHHFLGGNFPELKRVDVDESCQTRDISALSDMGNILANLFFRSFPTSREFNLRFNYWERFRLSAVNRKPTNNFFDFVSHFH